MKTYVKPMMQSETFVANEYIAACWKINCNVPTGYGFIDKNGNKTYDQRTDEKLTSDGVYGCGVWHKGVQGVPGDGPKANAMWQPQHWTFLGGYRDDGPAYDVYYWSDGYEQTHRHFSKVSDAEWETNPNAS